MLRGAMPCYLLIAVGKHWSTERVLIMHFWVQGSNSATPTERVQQSVCSNMSVHHGS